MAHRMSKEDKEWQAEMDARTLANADAIQSDDKRSKEAAKAAKRLAADEKKAAKEANERAKSMEKLAAGGKAAKPVIKKPAKKVAPRPKAKPRPAPKRAPARRKRK